MKEERDWRPRWIDEYSYSNVNNDSLPIVLLSPIQHNWDLDRITRQAVIAYPDLEPVYILKSDISYGFYHIALQPADAPKLGLVFPLDGQR